MMSVSGENIVEAFGRGFSRPFADYIKERCFSGRQSSEAILLGPYDAAIISRSSRREVNASFACQAEQILPQCRLVLALPQL